MVLKAKPRKKTTPKKTVLEAKAWLKAQGFTDEDVTEIEARFTPEKMAKIAEGTMRQDEFDRTMDEGKAALATEVQALADANARLNTEMAEWATHQNNGKAATVQMQTDLDAAQARVTQLTSRVTKLATEAGVDPKALLGDVEPVKPKEPDMKGFVRVDDLDAEINKRLGRLATGILDVPAELFQLGQEHQKLFGESLDTRPLVAEIKKRAATQGNQESLDPRAVWEEMHSVVDKRTEVDLAAHDAEITAAVERGRQEGRSEQALPGSTTMPGHHAAVFVEGRKSALERPQPLSTVTAAATALRSGKYRQTSGSGAGTGDGAGATT